MKLYKFKKSLGQERCACTIRSRNRRHILPGNTSDGGRSARGVDANYWGAFQRRCPGEKRVVPSWQGLLRYVIRRANRERLVIVIDEFPYLAGAVPALPSIIQSAWDHEWQNTKLKVVLSGSYISATRRLEDAYQPLYGRRMARLTFSPFTYRNVARFVPDYEVRDQLRAYGIFGGLPGNLTLLDPAEVLEANVGRLVPAQRMALVSSANQAIGQG